MSDSSLSILIFVENRDSLLSFTQITSFSCRGEGGYP